MRTGSRFLWLLLLFALPGCSRERAAAVPAGTPRADSGSVLDDRPLDAALPAARPDSLPAPPLTGLRIAPAGELAHVPPPDAAPAEPPPASGAVDRLPEDDALRPPVLRTAARWPLAAHARGWIEVDVLVDERGVVADVRPAAGTGDSATVRAALLAARSLRYYPARMSGRPVAVWCRQRFDSGR